MGAALVSELVSARRSPLAHKAHGKSNPRDMWIDVYAKTVLEPFGLANRPGGQEPRAGATGPCSFVVKARRSQFMAADEASLQRILAENPSLQREQFLVGSRADWSGEWSRLHSASVRSRTPCVQRRRGLKASACASS